MSFVGGINPVIIRDKEIIRGKSPTTIYLIHSVEFSRGDQFHRDFIEGILFNRINPVGRLTENPGPLKNLEAISM